MQRSIRSPLSTNSPEPLQIVTSRDRSICCRTMGIDNLQQFITLRRQLTQEREGLRRLGDIEGALGAMGAESWGSAAGSAPPVMASVGTATVIKRTMSPAARARIAAAARKRWAAARKAGRNRL